MSWNIKNNYKQFINTFQKPPHTSDHADFIGNKCL